MRRHANLKNYQLKLVYDYLHNEIDRGEMAEQFGRSRTNMYYYIGRAMHYWLKIKVVKFRKVKDPKELGGEDV